MYNDQFQNLLNDKKLTISSIMIKNTLNNLSQQKQEFSAVLNESNRVISHNKITFSHNALNVVLTFVRRRSNVVDVV